MAKKITCENFVAEYARFMRLSVASPPDDLKVNRLQLLLKEHESICSGCKKVGYRSEISGYFRFFRKNKFC